MPTYKITDPATGKTVRLTGDSPPSETELNQIFSNIHGTKKSAPSPASKQSTPTPAAAPETSMWSRFKNQLSNDVAEPFRVASEAVTGTLSAANKAYKGITHGIPAVAGTLAGGGTVDNALSAGKEAMGDTTIHSPLAPSRTNKVIGGVIGEGVNKLGRVTGQPELVNGLAEAGGDILALTAIKPGLSAARGAAGAVKNKLSTVGERGILPYGRKRAEYKAGEKINNLAQPVTPEHAATQQANVADAQALNERIMAHRAPEDRATFTPGQQGMDRHGVNELVRRSKSKDDLHAVRSQLNDDTLVAAARESVDRAIPDTPGRNAMSVRERMKAEAGALETTVTNAGQSADAASKPFAATESPATVGERITDALTAKRSPEKAAKKAAYDEVDALGYNMKFPNYEKHVAELESSAATEADPMIQNVINVVKGTLSKAKSTSGYDAIYQTLNGYIRDLTGSKTPGASRAVALLNEAKSALKSDAEALSKAAESGDVAIHNGQIVQPSEMKSEITTLEKRISAEREKAAVPDVDTIRTALMQKGDSSAMKVSGEKPADYAARVTRQFKKSFPDQPLPTASVENPAMVDWVARRDALKKQLTELKPAEDFAAKYKRATTLAKEEADRYGKGASDDVFRQGKQAGGQRLPSEKLPSKFETESGADDLARSLSDSSKRDSRGRLEITESGRKAAGDLMRDHFADKASTMLDNPKKLTAWVNSPKIKPVLQKLGLYDEFNSVSRAKQTVAEAQATLDKFNKSIVGKVMEQDPDKIVPWIHKQADPATAMREVLAFGKDTPGYKEGLQVAVRDWVMTSGEVTAEDMLGFNKTSLSKSKKLEVARTKRMLREVFDGKQMDALSDFHETIRNISRNKQSPHGAQSATTFLQSKEMGQVGYGVARDVLKHVGGQVVNAGANIVRHFMKGMIEEHGEMIEQFVDQAAFNPKDAKMLTEAIRASQTKHGVSEAMRKQIAARIKGYAAQAAVRGAAGNAISPAPPPPQEDQWGTDDTTTPITENAQ